MRSLTRRLVNDYHSIHHKYYNSLIALIICDLIDSMSPFIQQRPKREYDRRRQTFFATFCYIDVSFGTQAQLIIVVSPLSVKNRYFNSPYCAGNINKPFG